MPKDVVPKLVTMGYAREIFKIRISTTFLRKKRPKIYQL